VAERKRPDLGNLNPIYERELNKPVCMLEQRSVCNDVIRSIRPPTQREEIKLQCNCQSRQKMYQMACMPIDSQAHTSDNQHVGAGMTCMLHAHRGHAHAEHAYIY
jgi:hypothetical protein